MSSKRFFCTLFDRNYTYKGVVMLRTLSVHCANFTVYVLCMDDDTHSILNLLKLPNIILLRLIGVENDDLLRIKSGRTIAEYCWTLSSSLCWHIMQTQPHIDEITYLDADLMFFSDVEPLFSEINDASITVIEHRFTPRLNDLLTYGRFNVEWVGFKRDEVGMACLKRWRDQCIEWCFSRLEADRMGDQKYLDEWPSLYQGHLCVLKNVGAGIAPWNFASHKYSLNESKIYVDKSPLVFYHFHQFQLLTGGKFNYMSERYSGDDEIPHLIYESYIDHLQETIRLIASVNTDFIYGLRPATAVQIRRIVQTWVPISLKNFLRKIGIQSW